MLRTPSSVLPMTTTQRRDSETFPAVPGRRRHFRKSRRAAVPCLLLALALLLLLLARLSRLPLSSQVATRRGSLRGAQTPAVRVAFNGTALKHLIIVAGHAVTVVEDLANVGRADSAWYLLDYQMQRDLPKLFVSHIQAGVRAAAADPESLLVFSGGETRRDAGPRSEAQSYFFVAEHFDWWSHPTVASRSATEEFARDSFENLLFSIARFREITGAYPQRITVVSFGFKRKRFVDLHAAAIRWPVGGLSYLGLDPPSDSSFDLAAARAGELSSSVVPFTTDPYGCFPPLSQKRATRDPFKRTASYAATCPEIAGLLGHCGPQYNSTLPWSTKKTKKKPPVKKTPPSPPQQANNNNHHHAVKRTAPGAGSSSSGSGSRSRSGGVLGAHHRQR